MPPISKTQWIADDQGEADLIMALGEGMDGLATGMVDVIRQLAPAKSHRTDRREYRPTIQASTYVQGKLIAGTDVSATQGFVPDAASLHSIVWTDFAFAPMLELTGAKPHDIPRHFIGANGIEYTVMIHHPGFVKRPHFAPGALAVAAAAGGLMAGRVKL